MRVACGAPPLTVVTFESNLNIESKVRVGSCLNMFAFGKKKEKPMKPMKIETYIYPTAPTSKIKQ